MHIRVPRCSSTYKIVERSIYGYMHVQAHKRACMRTEIAHKAPHTHMRTNAHTHARARACLHYICTCARTRAHAHTHTQNHKLLWVTGPRFIAWYVVIAWAFRCIVWPVGNSKAYAL